MANESEYFIYLKEFARRLNISKHKAVELARSSKLCDMGISVDLNMDTKEHALPRIHWPKYEAMISGVPYVPEHKRVRPRRTS